MLNDDTYEVRDSYFLRTFESITLNSSDTLLNILMDPAEYENNTLKITRNSDKKELTALKGSILSIGYKYNASRYGYHQAVAEKIGNIAGQRFLSKAKPKVVLIKSKCDIFSVGNHMTRGSMVASLHFGCNAYTEVHGKKTELDIRIYGVKDGFIYVNLTDVKDVGNTSAELLSQTADSLIRAAYPKTGLVSKYYSGEH